MKVLLDAYALFVICIIFFVSFSTGLLFGFWLGVRRVTETIRFYPPDIGQLIQLDFLGFKYPQKPFKFLENQEEWIYRDD